MSNTEGIYTKIAEDAVEKDLPEFCKEKELKRVLILTGETTGRVIGDKLHEVLNVHHIDAELFDHFTKINRTQIDAVHDFVKDRGFKAIVGAGGGKNIDGAKVIATQLEIPSIAVPSRLSNDGLISPSATRGEGRYLGSDPANPPIAVFVDYKFIETPENFPHLSSAACDLYSKFFSVRDRELAYQLGKADSPKEESKKLAIEVAKRVKKMVEEGVKLWDRNSIDTIFYGIIYSGKAMIEEGSTDIASGGEHKIAHGINSKLPNSLVIDHGHLVSIGTDVVSRIYSAFYNERPYGEGPEEVLRMKNFFGVPITFKQYGVSKEMALEGMTYSLNIRFYSEKEGKKGRYTSLERARDDGLFDISKQEDVLKLVPDLFA